MDSPKRLYRNSSAGRIAGVCAGIADYLGTDVTVIRLVWIVLSVFPGAFVGGAVAYIAAWLIVPDATEPTPSTSRNRLTRSRTNRMIAGVCGGLADYLEIDATIVRLAWAILTIVPGAIVLGVVAYLLAWLIMPESDGPATVAAHSTA